MKEMLMIGGELSSVLATALIFDSDDAVEAHISRSVPVSREVIFNQWPRASDRTFFIDPSVATGNAAQWQYNDELDNFYHPINTTTTEKILSPFIMRDNYEFDVVITSHSNDDDAVGAIIAFQTDENEMRFLATWVHTGGNATPTVTVRYGDSGNIEASGHFRNLGAVIASKDILTRRNSANGGWGGGTNNERNYIRVNASKVGNIITVTFTDWNLLGTLLPESEMIIDLTTLPRDGYKLGANNRVGFGVNSQPNAYFEEYTITAENVVDQSVIYSKSSGNRWDYNQDTEEWVNQGNTVNDDFTSSMTIASSDTGRVYRIEDNTFEIISDRGIAPNEISIDTQTNETTLTYTQILSMFNTWENTVIDSFVSITGFSNYVANSNSIVLMGSGSLYVFFTADDKYDYKKITINVQ